MVRGLRLKSAGLRAQGLGFWAEGRELRVSYTAEADQGLGFRA